MVDTVRERVLAAFFAVLEEMAEDVFDLEVQRNLDTEVTHFPTLVMLDGQHQADDTFAHGITRYTMPVTVEAYVQAPQEGQTVHARWDELYGNIVAAATADVTLGGLAVDVTEQDEDTEVDRAPGHVAGGALAVTFLIEFWTRQGDPYTLGP